MAATTTEIKRCANACRACGGETYLRMDINAEGRAERLYIQCLKCGPLQVLSTISPDDARQASEEIERRVTHG